MPRFGIPNQEFTQRAGQAARVNWRRGLFRVWLLLSASWIMGWIVYLTINGINDGLRNSTDPLDYRGFVDRTADCSFVVWDRGGVGASRLHRKLVWRTKVPKSLQLSN